MNLNFKLYVSALIRKLSLIVFLSFTSFPAFADVNNGDTAWVLTSTALVLFMTLPGLALFYAGLVNSKNVVSVLMQHFAVACVVSIIWVTLGYSLAFSSGNAWIGDLSNIFMKSIDLDSTSGTIPESLFATFQMTFAIITPALIIGAFVERIKFSAMLIFISLWMIIVYAPVTHWVWGGGILSSWGAMDFAGGLVVHATAGTAALVTALTLGKRRGFPKSITPPHSPILTMIGAAMLWVGWFGFNAGSALGANGGAGMAMLVTHISASMAALVWMFIEWKRFGKPSLIGVVTGMVAGLATVTPASGYIGIPGGLVLGFSGGLLCYLAVDYIRGKLLIDDSLDVFAVHGVGGILGTLLVAFLATSTFSGLGLPEGQTAMSQFLVQIKAVILTVIWTSVFTYLILKVTSLIVPLRVDEQEEIEGLDLRSHGEKGYHSD
ncbi:ammonium transporter [Alphaproteobacteria bacterium]|nr:ammonium transporter [Alphaproteobacteria bacterium]